jgi:hypothetical protein
MVEGRAICLHFILDRIIPAALEFGIACMNLRDGIVFQNNHW